MKRSVPMHHELADRIRALIQARGLTPETPLPSERELASLLSVSRTSLRTGLVVLHLNGEIEIERGSASFVRAPSVLLNPGFDGAGPLEMLRARLTIESTVASEAALRADTMGIGRLSLLVDAMRTTRCRVAHRSLSRSFHCGLALLSGQPAVADILKLLMNGISSNVLDGTSDEHLQDCLRAETSEHNAILEAVIVRDAAKAVKSMRHHLLRVEERLREGMRTDSCLDNDRQLASSYLHHRSSHRQHASIPELSAFSGR